jgi:Zn-dependent peptidase ImmA (M78 family)
VSPRVLEWARLSSGATIDEAASRVSQDVSVIEAWEAGAIQPTLGALTDLAALYDQPLSVFLLDDPPAAPARPPDLRAAPARNARPLGRQSVLAINQARRIQKLVASIRRVDGYPLPDVRGAAAEDAAAKVRGALNTSVDEQSSWLSPMYAFGEWRRRVERSGVVVLQDDLPIGEVRAFSLQDLPPVIVINEHDFGASKNFSLFHELGHIALRSGGICSPLGSVPTRDLVDAERWSDRFAGAVLVPAEFLREDGLIRNYGRNVGQITKTDLARVASRFNVSTTVIWYRLRQTELVAEGTFHDRWSELDHKPKKRTVDPENPPRISRARRATWRVGPRLIAEVIGAEQRGDVSMAEALRGLDVHLEDLDKLSSAIR